ncbi:hypothetical protein TNIN_30251 [Trichonephila inaurata madagascariensis]|uniref:Uncharacterized protein n=1 Tax=Trichonephila inaurata madagascariensis TaxID=2747483 RepID=A0A8X6XBM4_9ARAC|nr:hypothetical protein TNIN_30251 [Trichonephila inaurata madagascariensis]
MCLTVSVQLKTAFTKLISSETARGSTSDCISQVALAKLPQEKGNNSDLQQFTPITLRTAILFKAAKANVPTLSPLLFQHHLASNRKV